MHVTFGIIIAIIILLIWEFFIPASANCFYLSDNKSTQVSRTLLSILADLSNAFVWMVSTCPFIFKSSSPFGDSTKRDNYNWNPHHFHVP